MQDRRLKKIEERYQQEMTQMLFTEIKDPRLAGVRVTYVRVTPDLRLARVYFSMDGGRAREGEVLKGFRRSKGYIKRELAARVQLRFMPDLSFFYDELEDLRLSIENVFQKLDEEKKQKTGGSRSS